VFPIPPLLPLVFALVDFDLARLFERMFEIPIHSVCGSPRIRACALTGPPGVRHLICAVEMSGRVDGARRKSRATRAQKSA
jgi:hypothetical protein